MVLEKIETDVNTLILVLTMKINFPIYFAKIELFSNFETKSSLSTSVFVFSRIFKNFENKILCPLDTNM